MRWYLAFATLTTASVMSWYRPEDVTGVYLLQIEGGRARQLRCDPEGMLYAHLKVDDVQDRPFCFAHCCLQLIHVCLQETERFNDRSKHVECCMRNKTAKRPQNAGVSVVQKGNPLSESFLLTRAQSRSAACPAYLTPIAALKRSGNLCALSSTFAPNSRAAHATTFTHASHVVIAEVTEQFQQLAINASRQRLTLIRCLT